MINHESDLERRQPQAVLIVDDDPTARLLLEREVRDLGQQAVAVDGAPHAMAEMQHKEFALVITDIRMPGGDGVELTRWVKSRHPDTEVMLVTGFATIDSAAEALRLGARDYLVKPFDDLQHVRDSITRALAEYATASTARQRVRALEAQHEWFADLLDRLPFGVVLVDREAKAIVLNRAAQALLGEQDGLRLNAWGCLVAAGASDTSALRSLVNGAASTDSEAERVGGAVTLTRPSGRSNLAVAISPMSRGAMTTTPDFIVAAVCVSDPERRVPNAEDLLRSLYGLTPAEATLAATLMQGHSLEQASRQLGVSLHTVRTHVKRVFAKTGTSRQGELISLLLSGPALLRLSPFGEHCG